MREDAGDAKRETARVASSCSVEDWARIKSSGRQGVVRAFEEGGARKAKTKLSKVLAAADTKETEDPGSNPKKRRRRANARQRASANANGCLTNAQLFLLFVSQQENWLRISTRLKKEKRCKQQTKRNSETLRHMWLTEFSNFQVTFISHMIDEKHVLLHHISL